MKQEELQEILKEHKQWLNNGGGQKADLREADLREANLWEADLREANLWGANLWGANLWGANLWGANLRGANLWGANLWGANLREADLREANLREADLREANLWEANLSEADLREANLWEADLRRADLRRANLWGANLWGADLWEANLRGADLRGIKTNYLTIGISLACPEEGSFIAWKKVSGKLVKLLIPEDAKRSSATTSKCRCSKAIVLWIEGDLMSIKPSGAFGPFIDYRVQEIVEPDSWDPDRWNECSHGVHFFMNRDLAESWA